VSKDIQAYFRNEDEAEGARASLMALQANDVEVERLSDSLAHSDGSGPAFFPMSNNGFIVGSGPGMMTAQGLFQVADLGDGELHIDLDGGNSEDSDHADTLRNDVLDDTESVDTDRFQYTLSAKVSDDQYENIVHKLRSLGAYIQSVDK